MGVSGMGWVVGEGVDVEVVGGGGIMVRTVWC